MPSIAATWAQVEAADTLLSRFQCSTVGLALAHHAGVVDTLKRFVYILRSVADPQRRYIGLTADVSARLDAHNAGQNASTARWKPWIIDVSIEFRNEQMAERFEKYLKSGSGHAFAKRHFEDVLR